MTTFVQKKFVKFFAKNNDTENKRKTFMYDTKCNVHVRKKEKRTSMVKAATQATIPVQSKTSESIRIAQMDLFLSQLMQLPILELFDSKSYAKKTLRKSKTRKQKNKSAGQDVLRVLLFGEPNRVISLGLFTIL